MFAPTLNTSSISKRTLLAALVILSTLEASAQISAENNLSRTNLPNLEQKETIKNTLSSLDTCLETLTAVTNKGTCKGSFLAKELGSVITELKKIQNPATQDAKVPDRIFNLGKSEGLTLSDLISVAIEFAEKHQNLIDPDSTYKVPAQKSPSLLASYLVIKRDLTPAFLGKAPEPTSASSDAPALLGGFLKHLKLACH